MKINTATHDEHPAINVHSHTHYEEIYAGCDAEKMTLMQIINKNFTVLFLSFVFILVNICLMTNLWATGYFSNQVVAEKKIKVKVVDMYKMSGTYIQVETLADKHQYDIFLGWNCNLDPKLINTQQTISVKTLYRPYNHSNFREFGETDKFCLSK